LALASPRTLRLCGESLHALKAATEIILLRLKASKMLIEAMCLESPRQQGTKAAIRMPQSRIQHRKETF
jgi:hypothetical protein